MASREPTFILSVEVSSNDHRVYDWARTAAATVVIPSSASYAASGSWSSPWSVYHMRTKVSKPPVYAILVEEKAILVTLCGLRPVTYFPSRENAMDVCPC